MVCGPVFRVDYRSGLQVPVQEVPRLRAGQVEAVLSLHNDNDKMFNNLHRCFINVPLPAQRG